METREYSLGSPFGNISLKRTSGTVTFQQSTNIKFNFEIILKN